MQFLKVLPQLKSTNVADLSTIGVGLGDRHQQVVDGVTTNYTLDLAAGLTQVLDDGTNTYLYGNGRIAQSGSTTEYFLGDALGSVRQLADAAGTVTLTQSYAPYGEVTQSIGTSPHTSYAFTGEALDASGLTYLRARYYTPQDGRFISRDTWAGEYNRPLSLNRWGYVEGNPTNLVDPSGNTSCAPLGTCGPDVTEWYRGMMELHYRKGLQTQKALDDLYHAIDPLGVNQAAQFETEALRRVEFALYGLALDYGRIDFKKSVLADCPNGNCVMLPQGKRTVTLCGHCIDSSDMGNMMFGLGGQVRGFSLFETQNEAYIFNVMTFLKKLAGKEIDISALNRTDSNAVIPGYRIANTQAFSSTATFCQVINDARPLGYNDNADIVNLLAPNFTSVTEGDLRQQLGPRYSFLNRWSDGASTIQLLLRGGQ